MKSELARVIPLALPVAIICSGVYLIYPPASLIVLGGFWLTAALPRGKN